MMWDHLLIPHSSGMERRFWIDAAQSLHATQESLCCFECHRSVPGMKKTVLCVGHCIQIKAPQEHIRMMLIMLIHNKFIMEQL